MTADTHDTFVALERGPPALFAWSARLLPVALAGQFFLAGQSLFADLPWSKHAINRAFVDVSRLSPIAKFNANLVRQY